MTLLLFCSVNFIFLPLIEFHFKQTYFFLQSNLETNVSQDFLYLSGILEPDSALVLYGKGRPDQAILFVPRRDPGRELWDGPRSGKDGAAALTGIERVHSTEELGVVLKSLKGEQTN